MRWRCGLMAPAGALPSGPTIGCLPFRRSVRQTGLGSRRLSSTACKHRLLCLLSFLLLRPQGQALGLGTVPWGPGDWVVGALCAPGLYPLGASSNPSPPPILLPEMFPDVVGCPLGGKVSPSGKP